MKKERYKDAQGRWQERDIEDKAEVNPQKFQGPGGLAAAAARAAAARKKKAEEETPKKEEKKSSSLPAGLASALARRKEKA